MTTENKTTPSIISPKEMQAAQPPGEQDIKGQKHEIKPVVASNAAAKAPEDTIKAEGADERLTNKASPKEMQSALPLGEQDIKGQKHDIKPTVASNAAAKAPKDTIKAEGANERLTNKASPKEMQSAQPVGEQDIKGQKHDIKPAVASNAAAKPLEDTVKSKRPEAVDESQCSYMKTGFIEEVTTFLLPNSTIIVNAVATKGDKHFYRYSDDLIQIRDLIGPPADKVEIPKDCESQILELLYLSSSPKPLVFLVKELWGLDLNRGVIHEKSDPLADIKSKGRNEYTDLEVVDEGIESHQKLTHLLKSNCSSNQMLSPEQMDEFFKSLTAESVNADRLARQYLESILSIGAALIFFRFQCALQSKEEAKELSNRLHAALKVYFNKRTESALKSALGRISRAFRTAMSSHLGVQEPAIGDKEALWDFYTKSVPEIPILVNRYFDGDFDQTYLSGIPFIPQADVGDPKNEAKPIPKPEWNAHIKRLKAMFEAAESGTQGDTEEFDDGFVSSTMFSLEKLTDLLEDRQFASIESFREPIEGHIERLEKLLAV